jgi:alkylation response protein AidB-like acyl-CoA dehydrogenase
MTYRAPIDDILFQLRLAAGEEAFADGGLLADLGQGILEHTVTEAAKFAETTLAPLNQIGDRVGARFEDGDVVTAPGWREAYALWRSGGWNALAADLEDGGMGLPALLNAACTEIWNGANMAFALCPLLSHGAIDAIGAHANATLKEVYLRRIVSGEWTATMNLTEPQAGTDLALLRSRAEPTDNGAYRIFGQKIFITYGDHDLVSNIVHLVLARLPDAPAGTRGISLFLVPKFLPDANGAFTRRNDVKCAGLEHKLGIHGSPTCIMSFGEAGGATGFLVGEENRGLACMFTMMNNARLAVGVQGVAQAAHATQHALAYARERKQGRAPGAEKISWIIEHPDVMRMLLTMTSLTAAARAICFETAVSLDRAKRENSPEAARMAEARASLLTPVAKAFSSDIANEVASLGVQVFGGMGYIEETGAAQFMRDARICAIYEGTNGVQAMDLVTRKLPLFDGAVFHQEIADMRALAQASACAPVGAAVEACAAAGDFLLHAMQNDPVRALAGATPYLRLFALARGATLLDKAARAAKAASAAHAARWTALARFFAENIAVDAPGLAQQIMTGGDAVMQGRAALE